MPAPWEYHRLHEDMFLLVCRTDCDIHDLDRHPSVQRMEAELSEVRDDEGLAPEGPIADPRRWRGVYSFGESEFRIPQAIAWRKSFALVCDPVDDTHNGAAVKRACDKLNKRLAAEMEGLE